MAIADIEKHLFGRTHTAVTRVGLGGEGVLRTFERSVEAGAVIQAAIAQGITYYDCARVYSDSERYYGSYWKKHPQKRAAIFQTSKSARRDRQGALAELEQTLARLNTDYLDLWQIHDVRTEAELELIAGSNGALEAFVKARQQGRVRHIGVTGHHDPAVLSRAVREWPVDAVLMPVNPAEGVLGGFLTQTLPTAQQKGVAVIGMKILGAGQFIAPRQGVTAELLVRYALDQGITVAIVGCSTPGEVDALAEIGRAGEPLSADEHDRLIELFTPHARKLAFYRGWNE
jgi:aryl-alcohol dehydrogenase-like predicted oxidoreductase